MQTRTAYQYRLYPTHAQITALDAQLRVCRELYNAALQERRDAYRMAGKSLNYYDQANQLKEIRTFRADLAVVNFSACQDVLRRLQKAFTAFFARVKRGDKAGFPRFKNRQAYTSITWPSYGDGCKIVADDYVRIQGIGRIRFVQHRAITGRVKTVTIRRNGEHWYVCFSCVVEKGVPEHTGGAIGIDVGLEYFASMSDGTHIENPRFFRKSEKHLAQVQRKLSKLAKNSPLRKRARKPVTHAFRTVRNQRNDFLHKTSTTIAKAYSLIVVENLNIKGLASGVLAKSIHDAAWGNFIAMLAYKAVNAGSQLVEIDPRYTSQICPNCGNVRKKDLSERWHICDCGIVLQRDHAASLVILARGLACVGEIP